MADETREKATLTVGSKEYEDWETVWVYRNWTDGYHQFKFRCAERETAPPVFPGDGCTIKLAGKVAITGVVISRQVAYEAENHGVELQGVSLTWYAGRSSVNHATGNFNKKSFKEIVKEVLEPTKIKYEFKGEISDEKFDPCQLPPGQKVFDFLENLARTRKIIIACDHEGKYVFVGKHEAKVVGSLKEGTNILKCQGVISIAAQYSAYLARAQTAADDDNYGRRASQQEAVAKSRGKVKDCPLITSSEHPVKTPEELKRRCEMEQMWHEGQELQLTLTVQGWLSNGELWTAGDDVQVESPMIPINDKMKLQSVTFTQDSNAGSLTTLFVVAPWGLNERSERLAPPEKTGPRKNTLEKY